MTGIEAANALSKLVQVMCNDEEEEDFVLRVLRDHRTLQQKIFTLFINCILGWAQAHNEGSFDLRNESTVQLARKIIDMLDEENVYPNRQGKIQLPYI